MSHIRGLYALLALACALAPLSAQEPAAQGATACQLGTAGAGVAAPCPGPAALAVNPAALARAGTGLSIGYAGSFMDMDFVRDFTGGTTEEQNGSVHLPALFGGARVGRFSLGAGAWRPFAVRTEWPLEFEGRFVAYNSGLSARYLHAGAATELLGGRLGLGAGVVRATARLEVDRHLDLANELVGTINAPLPGDVGTLALFGIPQNTAFADNRISAEGSAWTAQLGVVFRATDRLRAAVSYLHSAPVPMRGTADFDFIPTRLVLAPNNPLFMPAGTRLDTILDREFADDGRHSDQNVNSGMTLPSRLSVGAAFRLDHRIDLLLDYERTDWSANDSLQFSFRRTETEMIPLEYGAAHALRLAGRYRIARWTASAGFHFATPVVSDRAVSPILADARVAAAAAGATFDIAPGIHLDAAYRYARAGDRRGRVRPRVRTPDDVELSEGVFRSASHSVAIGFRWSSGAGGRP